MEVKNFIHESMEKLRELGIDAMEWETEIQKGMLALPEEVMECMEPEQLIGMILSWAGRRLWEAGQQEMYVFDVEVEDVSCMNTSFLEGISRIAKGELTITDIEEAFSEEVFEAGTGIQPVSFSCNGTFYRYEAKFEYDWFDAGMLTFMNQVIEEQNTGSCLYVASDGYQDCIVFYRTKEWVQRFHELLGMELGRP